MVDLRLKSTYVRLFSNAYNLLNRFKAFDCYFDNIIFEFKSSVDCFYEVQKNGQVLACQPKFAGFYLHTKQPV